MVKIREGLPLVDGQTTKAEAQHLRHSWSRAKQYVTERVGKCIAAFFFGASLAYQLRIEDSRGTQFINSTVGFCFHHW